MNPKPVASIVVVLVLLKVVELGGRYAVGNNPVVLVPSRVKFETEYAVGNDLVVLPLWSVMGKTPYPDARALALVVKPLLRYGP